VTVHAICAFLDCGRVLYAKKLCATHYQQQRKGRPLSAIKPKRLNGEGTVDRDGYLKIYMPSHPNARKTGCVYEHTIVMSRMIGRALLPNEEVHHKNGNRLDNRPENLELWARSQPAGQRVEDLLEWAHQIIETYEGNIACLTA
jgi:hypothetical protein